MSGYFKSIKISALEKKYVFKNNYCRARFKKLYFLFFNFLCELSESEFTFFSLSNKIAKKYYQLRFFFDFW